MNNASLRILTLSSLLVVTVQNQAAEHSATPQELLAQENKRAIIAEFFKSLGVPANSNDPVSPLVAAYVREKTKHEVLKERGLLRYGYRGITPAPWFAQGN